MFNTQVEEDSAGNPFLSAVPILPSTGGSRTKPVRVLNNTDIAFEFMFTGDIGKTMTLFWWLEFWGDDVRQSLRSPPDQRVIPGIPPTVPWSREVSKQRGGSLNLLQCQKETRQTNFEISFDEGDPVWVREKVLAPWVRIGLLGESPGLPDGAHLLIAAHVGGHSEDKFLTENGDKPYVYNA
jgi:hypothetical protein